MRTKVLMLAAVAALTLCGVAYAAGTTTKYFVDKSTTVKPVKGGTKARPVTASLHLVYGEQATPSTNRPAITKRYTFGFQDMRENTNDFKACGSSTLVQSGPSGCPKGSQVGKGFFIAALSSSTSPTVISTCRAEVTIFNGGNNTAVIYVYKGVASATQKPAECPLTSSYAINARLTRKGSNLRESFNVPAGLRHQTIGAASFDVGLLGATVNVPARSRTIVTHSHGKTVRHRVGLLETAGCPANHQRQISVQFTPETGTTRTATRLVACK